MTGIVAQSLHGPWGGLIKDGLPNPLCHITDEFDIFITPAVQQRLEN